MTTCCIGYYSELTKNPQIIQGEYYEILNDPLYIKDYSQMIIPISDNSVFKNDKKENELMEKNNSTIQTIKGNGVDKVGCKLNRIVRGRGLLTTINNIVEHETHDDLIRNDIKKGAKEIGKLVGKKKGGSLPRNDLMEKFKMYNKKQNFVGEKLKNRLSRINSNKKIDSNFNKRNLIKNLLKRLK